MLDGLRFAWALCTYAAGVAVWVTAATVDAGIRVVTREPTPEEGEP